MVKTFLETRLAQNENVIQVREEATYIGYFEVWTKPKGKLVKEKTILILGTFQIWLLTTAGKV